MAMFSGSGSSMYFLLLNIKTGKEDILIMSTSVSQKRFKQGYSADVFSLFLCQAIYNPTGKVVPLIPGNLIL